MTQEITKEQAAQITTLDDYKRVTGARRFKRTTEEMYRGLSPEGALAERLHAVQHGVSQTEGYSRAIARQHRTSLRDQRSREIIIRIVPDENVDWDSEWDLPTEVCVRQDAKFYDWINTKLTGPYAETQDPGGKLMSDILNMGLGVVIDNVHFQEDIEDDNEQT